MRRVESLGITPQVLLDVFDTPVSFHRCLVPITGGVTSALMLSQAIWTTQSLEPSADGGSSAPRSSGRKRQGCRAGAGNRAARFAPGSGLAGRASLGMRAKSGSACVTPSGVPCRPRPGRRTDDGGQEPPWLRTCALQTRNRGGREAAFEAAPLSVIWPLLGGISRFIAASWISPSSVKAALLLSHPCIGRAMAGTWPVPADGFTGADVQAMGAGDQPVAEEQASAREVFRGLALFEADAVGVRGLAALPLERGRARQVRLAEPDRQPPARGGTRRLVCVSPSCSDPRWPSTGALAVLRPAACTPA